MVKIKNPNGYGGIVNLGKKRRKPFAIRTTLGWEINKKTGKKRQKYKYIDYFETRREAMIALAEYNRDPYDVDARKLTFEEVFNYFIKEEFPDKDIMEKEQIRRNGYSAAFGHAESLHNIKFVDIRKNHMQDVIDNCEKGHSTKRKIKTLFNLLYIFAINNDWIDKNYSTSVAVPDNTTRTTRKPFTGEEINKLWESVYSIEFADTALIMAYTGLRPGELLAMKNEDIFLEDRYMIGGLKTDAGKNRIIPIHKKIKPLIEKRMSDYKFLVLSPKNKKMSYSTFLKHRWNPLMDKLRMDHTPHNARHTFATLMDYAGANDVAIKKIMGHATSDITIDVYTHKTIEDLIKEVDLLN